MSRLITLIIVTSFLCVGVLPPPATADEPILTDLSISHTLWLQGTEEKKSFVAKIDGRKFSTSASLENYIATFPSGDRVKCMHDPEHGWGDRNPDYPELGRYCRKLKTFCQEHRLKFSELALLL